MNRLDFIAKAVKAVRAGRSIEFKVDSDLVMAVDQSISHELDRLGLLDMDACERALPEVRRTGNPILVCRNGARVTVCSSVQSMIRELSRATGGAN